jgi:hypothetical protein
MGNQQSSLEIPSAISIGSIRPLRNAGFVPTGFGSRKSMPDENELERMSKEVLLQMNLPPKSFDGWDRSRIWEIICDQVIFGVVLFGGGAIFGF